MRIITGHDRPRDGTSVFELTHKDELVFYGDARAIGDYLGVTPSAVKHERKVIDHYTRVIGQIEYVYYYRGKVGTRESLAQEFEIRKGRESQLITSVFIHDDTVYLNGTEVYLMHLDKYMNSLNKRKGIKHRKEVKAPRIAYKGENKRYVDSLYNNCFKGVESVREIKFNEVKRKALEEKLEYLKQFNEEQIELHKQSMEYKEEEQAVGNYYKKARED